MQKRIILFAAFYFFIIAAVAQERLPLFFRIQQKRSLKHVHHYVQHDTLVNTSGAIVHLYYSSTTHKPYLLLLHGMGVDAKSNWYKQVASLSRHYNLIMPDLIYFGLSKAKENDYAVEFQVRQIREAIQKLGIAQKLNVMGFSYGGLTAAVYNELYPEEVLKLVIVDGPVKFFSVESADSLARINGAENMARIIAPQSHSDFKAMKKAVISSHIPLTRRLKKQMLRYYFDPGREIRNAQINHLAEKQQIYQSYNYNLDKTPTLLIWGAKDGVVPLSVGEELHRKFPLTSQLIVYKKAKHDAHFRCARKLNREVVKFLSK